MIQIPKKVKVGVYEFQVVIEKNVKMGEKRCDGVISFFKEKVHIDQALPALNKEITLWHEMLHLVAHQYSLNLSERETDCLAHGIVGILKDNFSKKEA